MPSSDESDPRFLGLRLRPEAWQLLWFIVVGGSGVVGFVALSTLAIGASTGAPDWLVSALCYAAMILPVYLGHRRFSFRSEAPHAQALPRYVAVQVMAVLLAAAISVAAYAVPGVPTAVAAFSVSAFTAGFTFVLLKVWAFAFAR